MKKSTTPTRAVAFRAVFPGALRSAAGASAIGCAGVLLAAACTRGKPPGDVGDDAALAAASPADAAPKGRPRAEIVAEARAAYAAGREDPSVAVLGAMTMATSVMSLPAWPDSDAGTPGARLGYLRHGARVTVVAEPIVNAECPEGWYELLEGGGFICGKYATTDLKSPRVRLAPSPPNLDAGLPYRYGYNLTDGTPLYRRVLSLEDRRKYEPWLAPPPEEEPGEAHDAGAPAEGTASSDEGAASDKTDKSAPDPAEPPVDPKKPKVSLDELHGRGVLVRKMVHGFVLGLDKDFKAAHAHWWRTTYGFAVPFEHVAPQRTFSTFHGLWLSAGRARGEADGMSANEMDASAAIAVDAGAFLAKVDEKHVALHQGAIGFVTSGAAVRYLPDAPGTEAKKVAWGGPIPKRSAVEIVGDPITLAGVEYGATPDGSWVRLADLKMAAPGKPPPDLLPGGKWIDVDLTRQILIAFEGDRPVFATLLSSGRRNEADPEHDYPTPTGLFRIREKHVSATMDGNVASDVPYSIEDVPWVMYFQGSYALHGAFWHDVFGHQRSHGCVNLSPDDARSVFRWAEPSLPVGWHGVFASDQHPGTWVSIHEDATKR